MPPDRRQEYVQGACQGDRTLCMQVESLLFSIEETDDLLEEEIACYAARLANLPRAVRNGDGQPAATDKDTGVDSAARRPIAVVALAEVGVDDAIELVWNTATAS